MARPPRSLASPVRGRGVRELTQSNCFTCGHSSEVTSEHGAPPGLTRSYGGLTTAVCVAACGHRFHAACLGANGRRRRPARPQTTRPRTACPNCRIKSAGGRRSIDDACCRIFRRRPRNGICGAHQVNNPSGVVDEDFRDAAKARAAYEKEGRRRRGRGRSLLREPPRKRTASGPTPGCSPAASSTWTLHRAAKKQRGGDNAPRRCSGKRQRGIEHLCEIPHAIAATRTRTGRARYTSPTTGTF